MSGKIWSNESQLHLRKCNSQNIILIKFLFSVEDFSLLHNFIFLFIKKLLNSWDHLLFPHWIQILQLKIWYMLRSVKGILWALKKKIYSQRILKVHCWKMFLSSNEKYFSNYSCLLVCDIKFIFIYHYLKDPSNSFKTMSLRSLTNTSQGLSLKMLTELWTCILRSNGKWLI